MKFDVFPLEHPSVTSRTVLLLYFRVPLSRLSAASPADSRSEALSVAAATAQRCKHGADRDCGSENKESILLGRKH